MNSHLHSAASGQAKILPKHPGIDLVWNETTLHWHLAYWLRLKRRWGRWKPAGPSLLGHQDSARLPPVKSSGVDEQSSPATPQAATPEQGPTALFPRCLLYLWAAVGSMEGWRVLCECGDRRAVLDPESSSVYFMWNACKFWQCTDCHSSSLEIEFVFISVHFGTL